MDSETNVDGLTKYRV